MSRGKVVSRRALCATFALPWLTRAEVGQTYSPERVRYADPATEFEVLRLTDPAHSCYMPPTYGRIFARGSGHLLHASDRGGSLQAYTLDLKSGESRQITQATALVREGLTLSADERSVVYLDSGALWVASLSGSRTPKKLYTLKSESQAIGLSTTADGPAALLVEAGTRLLMVNLLRGSAQLIATATEPIRDPMSRPRRASLLYRTGETGLWLAHLDGQRNVRLRTAAGQLGSARWSRDGRTVLYLVREGRVQTLRELDPDTNEDRLVANTTQFVQFGGNADSSVFVGASSSVAVPYVFLLVRSARRELTLCEHRSSDPAQTGPVFSPDSQRIFFQSDRHGKPAIYSMNVEKLVEKTEDDAN